MEYGVINLMTNDNILKRLFKEIALFIDKKLTGHIIIEVHIKDGGIADSNIQILEKGIHKT